MSVSMRVCVCVCTSGLANTVLFLRKFPLRVTLWLRSLPAYLSFCQSVSSSVPHLFFEELFFLLFSFSLVGTVRRSYSETEFVSLCFYYVVLLLHVE